MDCTRELQSIGCRIVAVNFRDQRGYTRNENGVAGKVSSVPVLFSMRHVDRRLVCPCPLSSKSAAWKFCPLSSKSAAWKILSVVEYVTWKVSFVDHISVEIYPLSSKSAWKFVRCRANQRGHLSESRECVLSGLHSVVSCFAWGGRYVR